MIYYGMRHRRKTLFKALLIFCMLVILYKAPIWKDDLLSPHGGDSHQRFRKEEIPFITKHDIKDLVEAQPILYRDWQDESMHRFSKRKSCHIKLSPSSNFSDLIASMQHYEVWDWIKKRITGLSDDWIHAAGLISDKTKDFKRKNILIIPGVLRGTKYAHPQNIAHGGPLGELLQWADLIAGLYVMGHNITLEQDYRTAGNRLYELAQSGSDSCSIGYDLIYLDILAITEMPELVKDTFRCRFRVLDVYGTHAMYNDVGYSRSHGLKAHGRELGLHLKQYFTFYPQTPDNSFLGFVVRPIHRLDSPKKENIGILYGKDARYARGQSDLIRLLANHIEIHYTMAQDLRIPMAHNLINHGVLTSDQYSQFLDKAKLFIGLGDPIEGTGVMEALAHGCVFINPKFKESSQRRFMDERKPTNRLVTSQIPYFEKYIGPPHVYTVDMEDTLELVENIELALEQELYTPFIPDEFTMEGYLLRLANYVEHQDFCTVSRDGPAKIWPPVSALRVVLAEQGQSCENCCHIQGQVCEPMFFPIINNQQNIERFAVNCTLVTSGPEIWYPAIDISQSGICWLQEEAILFSCAGSNSDLRRLCPCRKFQKYQIALSV